MATPPFQCLGQRLWSYPDSSLFLTSYLVHQQIILGLLSNYIPNMITSCSILCQHPGPSRYPHFQITAIALTGLLVLPLLLHQYPPVSLTNPLSTQQLVYFFFLMLVRSYTTLLKAFLIYCVPSHSTPAILLSLLFLEPLRYIPVIGPL